jgi:UDP-N-acetylglucosamine--N-acetylmuramyl-(pentapeptide) pyrophosphoryl-undecaprenol N-acetylglucosamine transferase
MTHPQAPSPFIAIACGGTGGHLFPGLAVAGQLVGRNCAVALLVSPKEVDQQAVRSAKGVEIVTLPAVALQRGSRLAFLRGCWQSWRAAQQLFQSRPPQAALAMGGFTSAPPILAARRAGARTFLHESNSIPGRANGWLARFVDHAFVGFSSAAPRLHARAATVTGTPVRPQFRPGEPAACRAALGLNPADPVLLVTGGSQGATGLNEMILEALPQLAKRAPHWQWLHLAGPKDSEKVKPAYAAAGAKAVVHPFLEEMHLALGAASAVVSRAGASSLAEIAAMRVPSLLVPFPHAAGNHQLHNARAFAETGAARLLEQKEATPEKVVGLLLHLVENTAAREKIQAALLRWHSPGAAEQIAEIILHAIIRSADLQVGETTAGGCGCGPQDAQHRSANFRPAASRVCTLRGEAILAEAGRLEIGDTAGWERGATLPCAVQPHTNL